jgi:hypothetical protein
MLNNMRSTTENDIETSNGNGHTATPTTAPVEKPVESVLADLKSQIEDLQKQLSMAKGTRNEVRLPVALEARIEHVLRSQICTTEELAKILKEPMAKVTEKLKSIRRNLSDVGTPSQAKWTWKIGDNTPAKELKDLVARLITYPQPPMTTAELARITGARMPRVNGVLVELQRDPAVPIFDLGSSFRAKWLILPRGARPANLPPKAKK